MNLKSKKRKLRSYELILCKPVKLERSIKFDDAMRRAMRVPPPPSGKKAQRKVWRKKRR